MDFRWIHEFCLRCDQENVCERADECIAVKCIPVEEETFIGEGALKLENILKEGKIKEIVDYKILRSYGPELLEESVMNHLKDGYILQGGVSSGMNGEYYFYCQAVVKYE